MAQLPPPLAIPSSVHAFAADTLEDTPGLRTQNRAICLKDQARKLLLNLRNSLEANGETLPEPPSHGSLLSSFRTRGRRSCGSTGQLDKGLSIERPTRRTRFEQCLPMRPCGEEADLAKDLVRGHRAWSTRTEKRTPGLDVKQMLAMMESTAMATVDSAMAFG
ncbi:hypothetical protein M440DRAFT_1462636 [Trichoderma longibrachiatum ATCC 18648]|uniref:Uncharacterized protein n=1 Tax=Trichoderma longibrachiatum ATCC 18648 TaxID=983965 RepID=A0A2T4C5F4_TRILO|nr:hypothetical protein M440DRAFT_1462636 [Trichoderma longibrachiatum ATCC 18648]